MEHAKEKGSEKAENTCFLAEVRLTSIMWSPPTLLPVHGINEDAGIIGKFLMQKTSAPSPCYHFTDCFIGFEVKLLLFTLPDYEAKAIENSSSSLCICLFNIYSLNLGYFNFL